MYTSMICLLVVLFFSVTGITLNHPDWVFGDEGSTTKIAGTLPPDWKETDGKVNWFVVAEHLRAEHRVRGQASDEQQRDEEASISFKGPSYQADAFIEMTDGSYELEVTTQGFLALINDLHKGRDTTKSWRWLIDVSGALLIVVSLTGLFLQFFLRKRRRSALVSAAVGASALFVLMWIATR